MNTENLEERCVYSFGITDRMFWQCKTDYCKYACMPEKCQYYVPVKNILKKERDQYPSKK